jgi:hypothetical protein
MSRPRKWQEAAERKRAPTDSPPIDWEAVARQRQEQQQERIEG